MSRTPRATVQVTVKNIKNGKTSNGVPFRYGEAIFISSISPNEGMADVETLVTIFGQGFEAPVRVIVNLATPLEAQVISVAGTEIVARLPAVPENARSCGDTATTIEVTNINSNIKATGPAFTYRAVRPLLTSITFDSGMSNMVLSQTGGVRRAGEIAEQAFNTRTPVMAQ